MAMARRCLSAVVSHACAASGLVLAGCGWFVGVDFDSGHPRDGGIPDAGASCDICPDSAIPDPRPMSLAAGGFHACVLTRGGDVKCWGGYIVPAVLWPDDVPRDSLTETLLPRAMPGLTGIRSISLSEGHGCAVSGDGRVKCWGHNEYGQLASSKLSTDEPVDIPILDPVESVAVGGFHTCVLMLDHTVKCWGYGRNGALGNGAATSSTAPVEVGGLVEVTALSAGLTHTCALTTGGAVKCWGLNDHWQLGNSWMASSSIPVHVADIPESVLSLQLGDGTTCALSQNGNVFCWGDIGETDAAKTPTPVKLLGVGALVSSLADGCLVTTAGGAKCWGWNHNRELGHGTPAFFSATPVDVDGLTSGVQAVGRGDGVACALMAAGNVTCWGSSSGALGRSGHFIGNQPPMDVEGL